VKRTDADYWRILDFHFIAGRPFTEAEDASGTRVAVITKSIAAQMFGSAQALGRTFDLDGSTFRVIGVVDDPSVTRVAAYSKMWLPIGTIESSNYRHELIGEFCGLVLAHSRSDFPRIKSEFAARLKRLPVEDPRLFSEFRGGLDTTFEAAARVVTRNRAGNRAPMILGTVFIGIAVLFMALPALNLITLNLSRILERASEIGVRKAFGAARPALVGQFITENVVLTILGGLIGFVLSAVALRLITTSGVIPNAQFDVNLRIFAWGMVITVFFGLLSGVYPAWRMSRLDPVNALRGGSL
jgi:putative ABC transport system permease protein